MQIKLFKKLYETYLECKISRAEYNIASERYMHSLIAQHERGAVLEKMLGKVNKNLISLTERKESLADKLQLLQI